MKENLGFEETDLVEAAVEWLRDQLPPSWEVNRATRLSTETGEAKPREVDGGIDLRGPNGAFTTLAVEARHSLDPRGVQQILPGLAQLLRTLAGNIPVLVVAPWLSARTQEVLAKEDINFLDLTGNALISVDSPTLFVRSAGAKRNPQRKTASRPRVRGPKAARLIRLLVDVRPPYGVGEIAAATQLAPGYVSRLLDTLDREALIERSGRGRVESADIRGLIRRWAESYDVLKTNEARKFVAANGANAALEQLAAGQSGARTAVTGSFAAVRFAPISAPALLLLYCEEAEQAANLLNLLPADEGANVALLTPFDQVVWQRAREDGGLRFVAPSQIAVDCLTGTGRMPAEGEALLDWMERNEPRWRAPSLDELDEAAG